MKKAVIAALVGLMAFAGTAMAQQQAQQNVGCGLGTILWGPRMNNATAQQVLAATTNGTFGNQTFGITSGTLDCKQPDRIVSNDRLMEFTAGNMDTLARDIAAGQGESLATLAELMEVPADQRSAFYANLQGNFGNIFVNGQEDAATFLDRVALATY